MSQEIIPEPRKCLIDVRWFPSLKEAKAGRGAWEMSGSPGWK
ncbi:MAG: hypothetical protein NUV68_04555 [Caldiserica bacterium]|nr:hypothetical protein [Caldisericota bacterium]MDH7563247.1 hypothetical protein [Caldisericota bacterium]